MSCREHNQEKLMKHSTYPALAGLTAMSLMASSFGAAHAQSTDPQTFEPPAVFQAAGPTTASIQASLDAYRLALGGDNNGIAKGPIATGRREINWDGGGVTTTQPAGTPFTQFLDGRGSLFVTPGSGFVQATPSGLAATFANPTYEKVFKPFSLGRLFSSIGSNVTVVTFFEPGSAGGRVATTRGFGAIFCDVDLPDGSGPASKRGNRKSSTLVEYYGVDGELLYSSFVPASPGDAGFSFLGITFKDARVASVRITAGDVAPGADDERPHDIVMTDDFIYGEPQRVQ
jgi:hypothetical protein